MRLRRATRAERALLRRALHRFRGLKVPDGVVRRRGARPSDLDQDQLAIGTKVELEHTRRPEIALEIAMAHLLEKPDYYARLERYVEKDERRSRRDPSSGRRAVGSVVRAVAPGSPWNGRTGTITEIAVRRNGSIRYTVQIAPFSGYPRGREIFLEEKDMRTDGGGS